MREKCNSIQGPFNERRDSATIERLDSRGYTFSEMKSYCRLPLHETNHVSAVCSTNGNSIFLAYSIMYVQNFRMHGLINITSGLLICECSVELIILLIPR